MNISGLSDKEVIREYEYSDNTVISELCKRLQNNLEPDECADCELLKGHITELEVEAKYERSEKEDAEAFSDKLESALRELDPDHELLA